MYLIKRGKLYWQEDERASPNDRLGLAKRTLSMACWTICFQETGENSNIHCKEVNIGSFSLPNSYIIRKYVIHIHWPTVITWSLIEAAPGSGIWLQRGNFSTTFFSNYGGRKILILVFVFFKIKEAQKRKP